MKPELLESGACRAPRGGHDRTYDRLAAAGVKNCSEAQRAAQTSQPLTRSARIIPARRTRVRRKELRVDYLRRVGSCSGQREPDVGLAGPVIAMAAGLSVALAAAVAATVSNTVMRGRSVRGTSVRYAHRHLARAFARLQRPHGRVRCIVVIALASRSPMDASKHCDRLCLCSVDDVSGLSHARGHPDHGHSSRAWLHGCVAHDAGEHSQRNHFVDTRSR